MTDLNEAEDIQGGDEPETAQTSAVEKRALEMGWVPQDEWRGPKDKWRPAEEFVAVGEQNLGLVKKELDRVRKIAEEQAAATKLLVATFNARERKAYERGVAEAEAKVEAAVESGDVRAYRAAQKELTDLQKEIRDTATPDELPDENKTFIAWREDNPWYSKRPAMVYADTIGPRVMMDMGWDGKSRPTRAMYDAVTAAVKEDHPEWFTNPRRAVGSGTEGRSAGLHKGGGKGWDDIPADVRDVAKTMIGRGRTFSTTAEYAKAFFEGS